MLTNDPLQIENSSDPLGIESKSAVQNMNGTKPSKVDLRAQLTQMQQATPIAGDIANVLGAINRYAVEPLTPHGLLSWPNRTASVITGNNIPDPNTTIHPDLQGAVRDLMQEPERRGWMPPGTFAGEDSPVLGAGLGVARVGEGIVNPEGAMLAPAFAEEQAAIPLQTILKRIIAGQIGSQVPEQVQQTQQAILNPDVSGSEKVASAVSPIASAVFAGLLARKEAPKVGESVVNKLPADVWYSGSKYQLKPAGARFEASPEGDIFDKQQTTQSYEQRQNDPLEIEKQKVPPVQPTGEPTKQAPQGTSNVPTEVRQGTDAGQGRPLNDLIRKVNPTPPEGQPGYGTSGNVSYTDPETGFTVENLPPETTPEQARPALQQKMQRDLVPAVATDSGIIKATSDEMLSHDDVLKANKIEPASIKHEDPRRGFVDSQGKWYTREQAEKVTGLKGTAEAGGLDSMDLPRASYEKGVHAEDWKNAKAAAEKRGTKLYGGLFFLDPDFWKDQVRIAGNVKTDGQMLYNRMRNALGKDSAAWKSVDTEEFRKLVAGSGRVSPDEVREYLEKKGPKVEVRKFGEGSKHPLQQEYTSLTHDFFDHLGNAIKQQFYAFNDGFENESWLKDRGWSDQQIAKAQRYSQILRDPDFIKSGSSDRVAHWQSIAPKSEKDMPGYTEIAVVKPLTRDKSVTTAHLPEGKLVEQFPSSHSFPPNTLGFVRGYMETTPQGKKVFHVIEVQSDWAKQQRTIKENRNAFVGTGEEHIQRVDKAGDPLLPHYERLALKAAIDHARSQGADAIAISDAETAMMTEGHDRPQVPQQYGIDNNTAEPSQGVGMRLHYDRTLPKIAEELTGEKGTKGSFGVHKMARDFSNGRENPNENPIRKDLIFRNLSGEFKTDVTARVYPIAKARENFSLFGSDKPKQLQVAEVIPQITGGGKMFSGVPIFDPEMLGITPEKAAELKAKYFKYLANKGQSVAGNVASAAKQFAPASARRAAILGSLTAQRMERTQEVIAQPGEKLGVGEFAKNKLRRILDVAREGDKVVNPWDVLYDWMDGGKARYNGPLMENIRKPLDSDFNDELNLRSSLLDPVRDLIKKNRMGKIQSERIGVYLNTLQEGGRDRMIASGIDANVIAKIEKTITPAEIKVAQAIRSLYDQTFPLIQKVAKDVDNINLNPIDNYFSWEREWRKYKPSADELATPNIPKNNPTVDDVLWPGLESVRTRIKPGSIEKRVPGAATPIKINAFEIVDRYVRDASHYITMRKHLKEISEIVRDDEFASKYGNQGQELVMEHLNTIARQGRYKRNAFLDGLRKLTSRGVIAFRIPSQLVHLANVPLGMQRAGVARWYKGLDEALSDEGRAFLKKNFAETFERGGGEPALREVAEGNLGKQSVYHNIGQAGFWLQRGIDRLNTQATVIGVYMRELEKKGLKPEDYAELPVDKAAVSQALVEARRAVASPLYKDVPPLLNRGGSLTKSLMQFQNTFLDQWSNIRYDLAQVGLPESIKGNPKLAMQMTAALATMLLVETGVKYGYKQGLSKVTGAKQREGDTFENTLEHEALRRVPGMGQLQSQIIYGETGIPSIDALEEPVKQGIKYVKSTDKASKTLAGTRAAGAVAEVAGVPGASQATDIVSAVERSKLFKSHTEKLSEQEKGKDVESMTLKERYAAEKKYKKNEPPMSKSEQASAAERSIGNINKRGEEIASELDKATRQWVESRGLTIPGYDNKLKIGKEDIYLDEDELKKLHGYIKDEYIAAMAQLKTREGKFDKLPTDEQKVYFNETLLAARSRARFKMMQEMSRSHSERDKEKSKPKKFSIFN